MILPLPGPVLEALSRITSRGHEAYAVGGCVRDLLRGIKPHDYDICASCAPEEIHACFAGERMIDTGIRHGTVTVLLDGMPLEITAFRADGDYSDGRHPDSVRFTRSLAEDLRRRDFTVNAMAYHPDKGVTDLFGGRQDLRDRVVRCVGDAEARFTEDALRILRALRFAAQLDFSIEPSTARAMRALRGRLELVSRERVAEELLRMLRYPAAPDILNAFPDVFFAAMPDFPPEAFAPGISALRGLPGGDPALALSALLHACEDGALRRCLTSLRLSKALEAQAVQLAGNCREPLAPAGVPLLLARLGEAQTSRLIALQRACGLLTEAEAAQRALRVRDALDKGLPLTLRQLPVTGRDLTALGFSGPAVGRALETLHRLALTEELPCEREALLRRAESMLPGPDDPPLS